MSEMPSLEELPLHELRRRAAEYVTVKPSYKKSELVKIIEAKGEIAKEVKLRSMPVMRHTRPALAMLPDEVLPELDKLKNERGLTWVIDDESGSITFCGDLRVCVTLDTTPSNITRAAKSAYRGRRPDSTSSTAPIFDALREMNS